MAHRFFVPDSSPTSQGPSTPDKRNQRGFSSFIAENPSTTPAGPPPSSAASFTPAGAPTDSFMGSSMMRGTTGNNNKSFGFGNPSGGNTGRSLFDRSEVSNAPLGRSIRGRGPSGLSQQYQAEEADEDAEGDDVDATGEFELPPHGGLFRTGLTPKRGTGRQESFEDDMEAEIERYIDQEMEVEEQDEEDEEQDDAGEEEEDEDAEGSEEGDMFLNMRHDDRAYGQPIIGEGDDLMMLNTPGAVDKVRKEAEDIYRRSSMARLGASSRGHEFQFATIAKDIYSRQDVARLVEPPELIMKTEDLVCRLYNEGVGAEENVEKLDNSLSNVTANIVRLWNEYCTVNIIIIAVFCS